MQVFTPEQESYYLAGLKAKNDSIFTEFYNYTKPFIRQFLFQKYPYRMDSEADDIIQETFFRVWKNIDSFRGDCKLISWVNQISIRLAIDKISRNKHFTNCKSLDFMLENGEDFESVKLFDSNETINNKICELKNCLGEKHLAVFNLVFEQGKEFKDAAKILKIPMGTVLSQSYYLRRKIKEKLA